VGELADRLDRLSVEVVSPDRRIVATIRGGWDVDVDIDPRVFHGYRERALGDQLSQLGRLAYVAYQRERRKLMDDAFAMPIYDDLVDVVGTRLRDYREGVANLVSSGTSDDRVITVRSRGLAEWDVAIAPDVIARMHAQTFVADLRTAVFRVFDDHRRQVVEVQDAVYGSARVDRR